MDCLHIFFCLFSFQPLFTYINTVSKIIPISLILIGTLYWYIDKYIFLKRFYEFQFLLSSLKVKIKKKKNTLSSIEQRST